MALARARPTPETRQWARQSTFAGRFAPPFPSPRLRRGVPSPDGGPPVAAPAHEPIVPVPALAHRTGGRRSRLWSPRKRGGQDGGGHGRRHRGRHKTPARRRRRLIYASQTVIFTVYIYGVITLCRLIFKPPPPCFQGFRPSLYFI